MAVSAVHPAIADALRLHSRDFQDRRRDSRFATDTLSCVHYLRACVFAEDGVVDRVLQDVATGC